MWLMILHLPWSRLVWLARPSHVNVKVWGHAYTAAVAVECNFTRQSTSKAANLACALLELQINMRNLANTQINFCRVLS